MTAWYSLLFIFVVPAADLGQRLLGVPPAVAFGGDLGLLLLGVALPRWAGWRHAQARDVLPVLAACTALAVAVYLLRVSAFTFSPYGENIYDLHYIVTLVQAQQWPAPELWNPGATLIHYYYLGFYIVAFYTRLLGVHAGTGYALFLLLVPVLVFANYWAVLRGSLMLRALASFTATFPSTGLSLLVASGALKVGDHLRGMAHVRLPEWSNLVQEGSWLARVASGDAYPVEGLAHLLGWLGDLHPPVFTFLLLAIVIGALCRPASGPPALRIEPSVLIAAAAVPLSFALNPWTSPCFALLGAYSVLRRRKADDLLAGLLGAGAMMALLLPLLRNLDLQTGSVALAWLPPERRSTLPLFLMTWGPLLLASLLLAALRLRFTLLLPFVAMILGLEVLLMDDPYGGHYERFNGVLKIGSLALAGWTAAVLAIATHDARRWLAPLLLLPLLALSLLQLVDALAPSSRVAWGDRNWVLQPDRMLQREDHRQLYRALSEQCPGLTLERRRDAAYADSPLVSTLLGWPTYSGWPSHLSQIGAMGEFERRRSDTLQAWFEQPTSALLRTWDIRYVLVDRSLGWDLQATETHANTLAADYRFMTVSAPGIAPVVGYFVATSPCAGSATTGVSPTTRSTR